MLGGEKFGSQISGFHGAMLPLGPKYVPKQ